MRATRGRGGRTVRVGIVGLGFMGRTHLEAYRSAARAGFPCEVVAVCDKNRRAPRGSIAGNIRSASAREALLDRGRVRRFTDPNDLFADPEIDLVSICTNTESHATLAIAALAAGKHVLVEKPVALDAATVARVARAAARARTLCMPAMCMRFWPGWSWLHDAIANHTFGPVRSAAFQRLSAPPGWSKRFYRDRKRTGGALVDLHIHDVDFIRWCFGDPARVTSAGTLDHVTTLYHFSRGPRHVVAEGGWDHAPGFPFRMRYTVVFERATAEFDSARKDALRVSRGGALRAVALEPLTGYDLEIRYLVNAVARGEKRGALRATIDDALAVTRILERERDGL